MSRIQHIRLMAEYNGWMNARLYASAQTLPPAALAADRKAFFGSILGTLNHLVNADTIWLKRFAAHPAGHAALDALRPLPMPTGLAVAGFSDIVALAAHRRWLDGVIDAWAGQLAEADLDYIMPYTNMKGDPFRREFFGLTMHFFNHQTHHRGQVTTLLSQEGVDMGATDLLLVIPEA